MAKAWLEDQWHYSRPAADGKRCPAKKCGKHKAPKANHGKGKRWLVRYYDLNRKLRSGGRFTAEVQAAARVTELNANAHLPGYLDSDRGAELFEPYARAMITKKRVRQATKGVYISTLAPAFQAFGRMPLRKLEKLAASVFDDFLAGLPGTDGLRQRVHDRLMMVFRYATRREDMRRNPMLAVERPRLRTMKRHAWTVESVRGIRNAIDSSYRIAVDLGACAGGARSGEIFAIGEDDLVLDGAQPGAWIRRQIQQRTGGLVYTAPKCGQVRFAPITPAMAHNLTDWLDRHESATVALPWERDPTSPIEHQPEDGEPVQIRLILTTANGEAVAPYNARAAWAGAREQVGITQERQAWHALRHWYVSTLLANGVPITDVAEYTGDTVAMLHRTYAHHIPKTGNTTPTWRGLQALDDAIDPPGTMQIGCARKRSPKPLETAS